MYFLFPKGGGVKICQNFNNSIRVVEESLNVYCIEARQRRTVAKKYFFSNKASSMSNCCVFFKFQKREREGGGKIFQNCNNSIFVIEESLNVYCIEARQRRTEAEKYFFSNKAFSMSNCCVFFIFWQGSGGGGLKYVQNCNNSIFVIEESLNVYCIEERQRRTVAEKKYFFFQQSLFYV